jgi:hypothetical protein
VIVLRIHQAQYQSIGGRFDIAAPWGGVGCGGGGGECAEQGLFRCGGVGGGGMCDVAAPWVGCVCVFKNTNTNVCVCVGGGGG